MGNDEEGRRGSTLILVVVLGALLGLLAFGVAGVAETGGRGETHRRDASSLLYACEGAAELLRLEVVQHLERSGKPSGSWLGQVRADFSAPPGTSGVPGSPSAGSRTYASFPDVHAWIDRVADATEGQWLEVVGATLPAVGETSGDTRAAQSVRLRVNVGQPSIFDLAMLTETTNCMFCHLKIRGDVGSIAFFRPGWGKENQSGHPAIPSFTDGSRGSGAGSSIVGDVYIGTMGSRVSYGGQTHILKGPSDDADSRWQDNVLQSTARVNGVDVFDPTTYDAADPTTWQPGQLLSDYTGSKLPADTIGDDGVSDFPSFDPTDAMARAQAGGGSVWAGSATNDASDGSGVWVVPVGSAWSTGKVTPSDQSAFTSTGSVIDGNLVLIGTADNPIKLTGDVFVKGDVVIKGVVEGQGAIYAGRNIYVTGDITYKNLPATWPLENDAEAQAAVQAGGADELRLAARSNIVIGDWTYLDDAGEVQRLRDRQGEDYMNAQFALNDTVRYYDVDANGVSHELTHDPAQDKFFDDLGQEVTAERVLTVDATSEVSWNDEGFMPINQTRYDSIMAPGVVSADDTFEPWLTQGEYRELLGAETYDAMTWRVPGIPQTEAALREYEYGEGWMSSDAAGLKEPGAGAGVNRFDADALGPGLGMYMKAPWPGANGAATARVMETGGVTWDTQVTHIDAFLYANKRIAGKVDVGSLTVNGGMAARELGVLAPGISSIIESGAGSRAFPSRQGDAIPAAVTSYYAAPGDNAYGQTKRETYLWYDYRLRNGGFGFNLISAAGDMIFYSRGGATAPDPAKFQAR